VCVCDRERERKCVFVYVFMRACVRVCVGVRERDMGWLTLVGSSTL